MFSSRSMAVASSAYARGLRREDKAYFAFRVDVWDGAGDNIVEHVAGIDDFETAVATYWAAVRRWPKAKITPRQRTGRKLVDKNSCRALRAAGFNSRLSPIAEKAIDTLSNSVGPPASRVAL
jgi:hypothetical protein